MQFIEEAIQLAIDKTVQTGDEWCVTLELKQDTDKWVQFTSEYVNMHYPLADEPERVIEPGRWKLAALELETWEPELFVTFSHRADETVPDVAEFVAYYIERILKTSTFSNDWRLRQEII